MKSRCSCEEPRLTRRGLLIGSGVTASTLLTGCLGERGPEDEGIPDPIDLSEGYVCHACGMIIGDHPGVAAQLYPEGDEVLPFDSVREALGFALDDGASDELGSLGYVVDIAEGSYEIEQVDDEHYLWLAPTADVFARFDSVTYIVGSSIRGAMGPELWPVSDMEEAEHLIETYGGQLHSIDEIDPEHLSGMEM